MGGYIIYHPPRCKTGIKGGFVYHDSTRGNQDPYVWNDSFLHTFCHITQMSPEEDHVNFWVSGDTFPDFKALFCDLVFVVAEKLYWRSANSIYRNNSIVDSAEAFNDHYIWARRQHQFKKRRRFTLKADPERSYQPQDTKGRLIDIVPALEKIGLSRAYLRRGLRAGIGSRPLRLSEGHRAALYDWISKSAPIKRRGPSLLRIRRSRGELASRFSEDSSCC